MISLDSLNAARPLAEALSTVRTAMRGMNQAPGRLTVYQTEVSVRSGYKDAFVMLPNVVLRQVLEAEESRLVRELHLLGVEA